MWIKPIKNKQHKVVTEAMKEIFKEMSKSKTQKVPERCLTDRGGMKKMKFYNLHYSCILLGEFQSTHFKKLMDKYGIKHIFPILHAVSYTYINIIICRLLF